MNVIDFFLHIDTSLGLLIESYGWLVYILLFLVIFCETGLVVTPFLPGDSVIFAVGVFCALGSLSLPLSIVLLCVAAIGGDTMNYFIGKSLREKLTKNGELRFIKRKHLDETAAFFDKHGGKAIVLARFIPVIRTFAPFVAGAGKMNYKHFIQFNILGGILWVLLFSLVGYFFGTIPFIKNNFSIIIIAIVLISFVPVLFQLVKAGLKRRSD